MRKLALFSVSAALLGNAYALVIGVPPADPFAPPESFRSGVYHHKEPCTKENSHCLANHLMYLQCGAILVEKMALEEGETSEWHALQHAQRAQSPVCNRRLRNSPMVRSKLAGELVQRRGIRSEGCHSGPRCGGGAIQPGSPQHKPDPIHPADPGLAGFAGGDAGGRVRTAGILERTPLQFDESWRRIASQRRRPLGHAFGSRISQCLMESTACKDFSRWTRCPGTAADRA